MQTRATSGGSITFGDAASRHGVTDWAPLVTAWLRRAFPTADVRARNGAVPGTPSVSPSWTGWAPVRVFLRGGFEHHTQQVLMGGGRRVWGRA
eukprot:3979-Chlamydomonas_euryale.AAC.1